MANQELKWLVKKRSVADSRGGRKWNDPRELNLSRPCSISPPYLFPIKTFPRFFYPFSKILMVALDKRKKTWSNTFMFPVCI